MKRIKSILAIILVAAMVLCLCACSAKKPAATEQPAAANQPPEQASSWPKQTVVLLCGYGAGGSTDLGIRALAATLEKQLGVSFVVQNVTGANGWICWSQLLESAPDGYTIAAVNTPALFADYLDPQRAITQTMDDFDFICNHVSDYDMIVCKAGKFKDIDDFMNTAKNEGVTIGDVGANGNKHIAILNMARANPDATLTPVHQSGWSDNYAALLGDTLDAAVVSLGEVTALMADGELTVLCTFSPEKLEGLNAPTCAEAGYGEVISAPSRGYMLPKGVDAATKAKIYDAFEKAIADPEHVAEMQKLGLTISYIPYEQYMEKLKTEEAEMIALKPVLGWE